VGSGFEPHWRPQPAKLPSFGGYSLKTLPYLGRLSLISYLNGTTNSAISSQTLWTFLAGNDQQQPNQPNDQADR